MSETLPAICSSCNQDRSKAEMVPTASIGAPIQEFAKQQVEDWSNLHYICTDCLEQLRADYMRSLLGKETEELTQLEEEVRKSIEQHEILSKNINDVFDSKLSLGERLADRIAEFGGSWRFIITFVSILIVWIVINSIQLLKAPFDPYPYILLNLLLSCLAALQAPVIMMSQNRQEAKDRMRAEHDFEVNLKAELEIRNLNAKFDQLITHQWQRLLEIQQIQIDMIEDLVRQQTSIDKITKKDKE